MLKFELKWVFQRYRDGPKSAVISKQRSRSPPRPKNEYQESYQRGGGGGGGGAGSEREVFYQPRNTSNKYDQDDPPSRMLLVSGLDNSITEQDLYAEFQRYASVMTIDIKVPREGPAFACVAFLNPDEAEKGMQGMQGKRIGENKVKIVYGTSPETACIWVGGLGKQTSLGSLENEFDRFGDIKKIDYSKGETFAYIVYSSSEGAKTAIKTLTGRCICGSSSPARFDYVEYDQVSAMNYHLKITQKAGSPKPNPVRNSPAARRSPSPPPPPRSSNSNTGRNMRRDSRSPDNRPRSDFSRGPASHYDSDYRRVNRGHEGNRGPQQEPRRDGYRESARHDDNSSGYGNESSRGRYDKDDRRYNGAGNEKGDFDKARNSHERNSRQSEDSGSPEPRVDKRPRVGSFDKRANYQRRDSPDEPRQKRRRTPSPMSKAKECLDVTSLAKILDSCWRGYLILKNSSFSTHMTLLDGSRDVCRKLLTESSTGETANALKITQRLRCETGKLEEVRRRMQTATKDGFCLLLATHNEPSPSKPLPEQTSSRTFKNLVTYLKSKQSAGVIGLPIGAAENFGVLHAFPPCEFFAEDLKKIAPKIIEPEGLEDHLLIVILSGSA